MAKLRKILALLIAGFVVGVVWGSYVEWVWPWLGLFLILAFAFLILFFVFKKQNFFLVFSIIFVGVILGLFRFNLERKIEQPLPDCSTTEKKCVGLIVADPDRRDTSTRLTVELVSDESVRSRFSRSQMRLRTDSTSGPVRETTSGSLEKRLLINPAPEPVRDATSRSQVVSRTGSKVLIITDNFTNYAYGDKVELVGKIERPQNFLIPPSSKTSARQANTVFDYQNYLLVRGIDYVVYQPKLKIISSDNGSVIKAGLYSLKNNFLGNLRRALPEPAASLAGGLILGDKGGLGKKVEDEFRQAGVSHIIVLSGYNITIVAESVLYFFAWLTPAFAWLLSIVSIFLFVLMTGGEAAAVRSAVMGAIALVARRYGRTYDAGVALVTAGFLMVLWNPRLLAFDLGFQLSFLATLGLIYLSPVVERLLDIVSGFLRSRMLRAGFVRSRFSSEPEMRLRTDPASGPVRETTWLREVASLTNPKPPEAGFRTGFLSGLKELICTTTGAQLAVFPWLLYKTGNASLIGFISNIFILPPIPVAMFLSFLTGITGFISQSLSLLVSYPTYFLLTYVLKMANIFASLL